MRVRAPECMGWWRMVLGCRKNIVKWFETWEEADKLR
jgi:hypothetical protein